MSKTNFSAKQHGFKFKNTFTNIVISKDLFSKGHPLKDITTTGLCGGMSYTALDYYFSNIPIPAQTEIDYTVSVLGTGAPNSELTNYIFSRQLDSYSLKDLFSNWNLNTKSDMQTTLFERTGINMQGVAQLTKNQEFDKLKHFIDEGKPVVLGLINGRKASFSEFSKNHQVVAYGYSFVPDTQKMVVNIYDPNWPDVEVTLTSHADDTAHPNDDTDLFWTHSNEPVNHANGSPNDHHAWRGFFVEDYTLLPITSPVSIKL